LKRWLNVVFRWPERRRDDVPVGTFVEKPPVDQIKKAR
jgi:hypothetical protein